MDSGRQSRRKMKGGEIQYDEGKAEANFVDYGPRLKGSEGLSL